MRIRSDDYGYTITKHTHGKRQSCKKVATLLGMNAKKLRDSCEAYGRDVQAYVDGTEAELRDISHKLVCAQIPHMLQIYDPGRSGSRVMINVTYFKAWHWDE